MLLDFSAVGVERVIPLIEVRSKSLVAQYKHRGTRPAGYKNNAKDFNGREVIVITSPRGRSYQQAGISQHVYTGKDAKNKPASGSNPYNVNKK